MSLATDAPSTATVRAATERSLRFEAMGGWVTLRVAGPAGMELTADRDLHLVADRIRAWADRITRFDARSQLSALNRDPEEPVSLVGPTLGLLLERAHDLGEATDGLVDVTQLDARLAVEYGGIPRRADHRWWLERLPRGHRVHRQGRVAFDLDGVGKGWIADRALALLHRYRAAMVDADGDVALRQEEHRDWGVAISDPLGGSDDLGVIAIPPSVEAPTLGIATSGTTVHRWEQAAGWAHHLIDPRTGASAATDVVQATVVADDALLAEALAKSVVIAGSDAGLRLLQRAGAPAALVLLRSGELVAPVGAEEWLA